MAIAPHIREKMEGSSFIRKMFEEGIALKKIHGADKVYDFSIGNPDLEPPKKILDTIKEMALSEDKGRHGYMPNPGFVETREAIAKKVSGEQGVTLNFGHTVMSVGAAGALNTVFKSILSSGDEIIVPAPFFAEYTRYAENHGGTLVPVPTKEDFSLDVEAIKNRLSEKTAGVLINSPNNPTGKIYSKDDIESLSKALKEHGEKSGRTPYLIADEPYRKIVYGGKTVTPVFPYYENAVVVSSFAKDLSLPGERLGYIAVNPACENAEEFIQACIFCTRTLGYVNAPGFFQRVIAKAWDAEADYSSYAKRRDALTDVLDNAKIQYAEPEGAFYLFCKAPEPKLAENQLKAGQTLDGAFCDHLKKYCILAVPGKGFGKEGYFRLAYCVSFDSIVNSKEPFAKAMAEW